ncbi:MAG: hypothetical protein H0U65_13850 [Rubrobacter sp.]|nr:hypothetical protein [Rubrobacter sp.]
MAERKYRDEIEEMSRAADRFAEAVDEFGRHVERLRPSKPLSEEELAELVDREVHAVREELYEDRKPERGPLTLEEAEEWKRRRNGRRAEGA